MFTTRCLLAELASLGGSHAESLAAACNLLIARCDHEKRKSGVDCIADVIGQDSSERFFVATPRCRNKEEASRDTRCTSYVWSAEGLVARATIIFPTRVCQICCRKAFTCARMGAQSTYCNNKSSTFEESKDSSSDTEVKGGHASGIQGVHMQRYSRDGKDKVQTKRKKAKAPNPLSRKKKKMKPLVSKNNAGPASIKEGSNTDRSMRSRSRKKKRGE